MEPDDSQHGPRVRRRGDRVADYVLEEVVGAGGMGVVWKARDPTGQVVAIKLLHGSLAASQVLVQRFLREVDLGARLDHPGIVRTLDGGLLDDEGGIQPWLAMAFVEGRTLRQEIEASGPLSEAEAREVGAVVADALHAIHEAGIVHRDVKPDNLIRGIDGRVQLMDLGVARARDEALRLTRSGQFAGSVVYAAPEQFHGGSAPLDGRADLYALGASLFELTTGDTPWPGLDLLAVYGQKMSGTPPSVAARNPALGKDFDQILARLMHPAPGQRPEDGAMVAAWLRGEGALDSLTEPGLTFALGTVDEASSLPRPDDAFVGRIAEMHRLDQRWEQTRLVTLLGVAGSGKTRMALEYGQRYRIRWTGGVHFVDLSDCGDRGAVLVALADALGLALQHGDAALQVGAALRGRRDSLWILDNAEQVREGLAELVARWLEEAPEACFLVTSRVPLGLPVEVGLPVEALGLPDGEDLDAVAASDAVRLFVDRARAVSPRFSLDEGNAAAVAGLVHGLDGLPLAIELAAARVRMLGPAQILERLAKRWALLRTRGGSRPARQATLKDAIRWSWDLLEPDEQRALAALSVFEGGFDAGAAEAVLDDGECFPLDLLEALVDHSLVRRLGGEPVRFGMYASIKAFAEEQLAVLGTAAEVRALQGRHFAALAREVGTRWTERGEPEALGQLVAEQGNLRAVAERVQGADGARAAWALGLIAERRGPVELGLDALSVAVARGDTDGADRLGLLAVLARLQGLASRLDDGLKTWGLVETLATQSGDPRHAAAALTSKAMLHMRAGRLDEARACARAGLQAQEALGNPSGVASAHRALGTIALHLGELDEGRRQLLLALKHAEPDDRRSKSALANNLGLLEVRAGRPVEGRAWLEQALAHDREAGDRVGEGKVLTNLGILAVQQGEVERARELWEQALEAHREGGNAEAEGKVLNNLSQLALQQGQVDLAWSLARSGLSIKRTLGQPGAEAYGRLQLAEVAIARERPEEARVELELAAELAEAADDNMALGRARSLLDGLPGPA